MAEKPCNMGPLGAGHEGMICVSSSIGGFKGEAAVVSLMGVAT